MSSKEQKRRTASISDIHGNYDGLLAVLADIARLQCDRILCQGDLVDGGPHGPILKFQAKRKPVSGNCRAVVVEQTDMEWPNRRSERSGQMSGVRLLVGTRKGAFILTSDGKRAA